MPARKRQAPAPKQQLRAATLTDADPQAMSRLLSDLASAHEELDARVTDSARASQTFDLKVGPNKLQHGLTGKPRGVTISPTVADATYAAAMTAADDKQATITVIGVAQLGAGVEFWR